MTKNAFFPIAVTVVSIFALVVLSVVTDQAGPRLGPVMSLIFWFWMIALAYYITQLGQFRLPDWLTVVVAAMMTSILGSVAGSMLLHANLINWHLYVIGEAVLVLTTGILVDTVRRFPWTFYFAAVLAGSMAIALGQTPEEGSTWITDVGNILWLIGIGAVGSATVFGWPNFGIPPFIHRLYLLYKKVGWGGTVLVVILVEGFLIWAGIQSLEQATRLQWFKYLLGPICFAYALANLKAAIQEFLLWKKTNA